MSLLELNILSPPEYPRTIKHFPTPPVSYNSTLTAPVPYSSSFIHLDSYSSRPYTSSSSPIQVGPLQVIPIQLQFYTIHVPCSSRSLQVIPYSSSSRTIQQQWHTTKVPYGFSSLQLKLTAFSVPNNYTFIQLKSHTISETYSSSSLQLNIPASSGKYRPSSLNLQTNTDPVP